MPRKKASQKYSGFEGQKRVLTPTWTYYGGAGTNYVALQLNEILNIAMVDPPAALNRLKLFLTTIPSNIAEKAYKAMEQVRVPQEVINEIMYYVDDGVIDETQAAAIINKERAWWQVFYALLEISDWLHDALFIKSQRLTEMVVEE